MQNDAAQEDKNMLLNVMLGFADTFFAIKLSVVKTILKLASCIRQRVNQRVRNKDVKKLD